jgi:Rieske Fe-S protein
LIVINGGTIYENTRAVDIEQGEPVTVLTANKKKIKAKSVVIATHFPFYDGLGLYFTRLYAERSYVQAVKIKEQFPSGIFKNIDQPVISLRSQPLDNDKLILVSGDYHKTGDGGSTEEHYQNVLNRAKQLYTVTENPYRWSAQDYNTPDGIPYIGYLAGDTKNIYVGTGFKKWGITTSTLAAMLIKDLITKGKSPWAALYNPQRFNVKASTAGMYVKDNFHVAKELVIGKLKKVPEDVTLNNDEGKIIEINGKKYGAYKDNNGKIHIHDTTCTHLGCELKWNDAEKTFDCPCHGSRFNYDGSVIEGPAHNPLKEQNNYISPNLK